MILHLLKLSVGSESLESLAVWQQQRLAAEGRLYHCTRQQPRRGAELLDGGSIYWVIKGLILARQRLIGLETGVDSGGRAMTRLLLDADLVAVEPRPHRAFQGWRYFKPADAPPDLVAGAGDLPSALAAELRALGCW
ncbi:MAG: DUF1489 domain-containing protein [Rhodospirillales bacterium]|nr:DUF1489 domain-containing protein [Rhodospirillales bacterium]